MSSKPETIHAPALVQERSLLDEIAERQATVASRYKPVMSIDELIERDKAITYLVEKVMREGVDYGWVPGTKPKDAAKAGEYQPKAGEYQPKPTLFKAGAERACAFFGYAPTFTLLDTIREWTPEKYGELLFFFEYRCTLSKDLAPVGEGIGSATTWESKYRYRKAERACPECGEPAIIKGKAEFGGGWLCWKKKGGCGVKFEEADQRITAQQADQIANPDVADVINTVQKMAQKRAYVAATLTATGLSGRFTQDLEDREVPETKAATAETKKVANGWPAEIASLMKGIAEPGGLQRAMRFVQDELIKTGFPEADEVYVKVATDLRERHKGTGIPVEDAQRTTLALFAQVEKFRKLREEREKTLEMVP
jgi:hypothetical protein